MAECEDLGVLKIVDLLPQVVERLTVFVAVRTTICVDLQELKKLVSVKMSSKFLSPVRTIPESLPLKLERKTSILSTRIYLPMLLAGSLPEATGSG